MDDPWMLNFGCEGTRDLDYYVYLPDDKTVFDANCMQKVPLKLRHKGFCKEMIDFIEEMKGMLELKLIKRPQTHEDRKYNQSLYNLKSDGIISRLRNHFKDLALTEDQHDWLEGRLLLKIGKYPITLPFYSKEKRARRHAKKKRDKCPLGKEPKFPLTHCADQMTFTNR